MLNKVKALTVLILFSAVALVSAEGYKPKAPKKGHVLVVGSVSYKKPIDIEARREGFGANKNLQIGKTYEFSKKADFKNKVFDNVSEGVDGYFFQEIKVPKDGKLYLNHIDVTLFGNINSDFLVEFQFLFLMKLYMFTLVTLNTILTMLFVL